MCGEHASERTDILTAPGSSPHVRGAPSGDRSGNRPTGIIPACAGSTISPTSWPLARWDHPRMCGEHATGLDAGRMAEGSSPHVRGALRVAVLCKKIDGIIPACAGSTPCCFLRWRLRWDHPRMCGEHISRRRTFSISQGSSPHVRGAHHQDRQGRRLHGIIPACAGSTPFSKRVSSRYRDHPRMCGEHAQIELVEIVHLGSSPHVRGAPRVLSSGFGR